MEEGKTQGMGVSSGMADNWHEDLPQGVLGPTFGALQVSDDPTRFGSGLPTATKRVVQRVWSIVYYLPKKNVVQ